MKPLSEIKFGFSDAENYRRRENKELFDKIFLRNDALERVCSRNVFFLVGEKGTGKTAYAVYLANHEYKNNIAYHKFIRETDYHKFISLKKENKLSLSEYTDIWRVIICLMLCEGIINASGALDFIIKFRKLGAIKSAIEEYYNNAFSPEIPTALKFIEDDKRAVELISKYLDNSAKLAGEHNTSRVKEGSTFQTNLLFIERHLKEALASIKLPKNHVVFIDGIDIRPSAVPYEEYIDCVKGLANAAWSLNNDFFPTVKDTDGRARVVLLLRPDIFNSLGLQNRNTKLKDNSVVLDWRTTYPNHRKSELFKLADRMFSAQQVAFQSLGECWDYYFPFDATGVKYEQVGRTSFLHFLRYSFYRPRDILSILDFLRELHKPDGTAGDVFAQHELFSPDFRRVYGEYLLGEVKDSLSFYYDDFEFELFIKFFTFLEGHKKFSYDRYLSAYREFSAFIKKQDVEFPAFMKTADEFLQFLYDLNIICYIEDANDEKFIRWCFVERGVSNISPKVKSEMEYEIHYGLANALNTGKPIKKRPRSNVPAPSDMSIGVVGAVHKREGYGFLKQSGLPIDIFFRLKQGRSFLNVKIGDTLEYKLDKDGSGRLFARNPTKIESEG